MIKIQKQSGAVLVISMIMLLLLTILGVTSMRTTQLEERMAGNARDRHVAFEAAEAALVDAEILAAALVGGTFDDNGSDGLYTDDRSVIDNIVTYVDWDGAAGGVRGFFDATNIGVGEGLSTPPKYVIQRILPGTTSSGGNLNPSIGGGYSGLGSTAPTPASTLVRITARGTGGSNSSVVFLQTIFGVENL